MNEQEKGQAEMETLLQRFTLTDPSAMQKQRVMEAACGAWQEVSSQAAGNGLRFARALAACILLVFAVDVCGRLALAPWRPHLTSTVASPNVSAMKDFHALVPSAKRYGTVSYEISPDQKTGLQDYRDQLNRLLNEIPQRRPQKQKLPLNRQGGHFPTKTLSWHS